MKPKGEKDLKKVLQKKHACYVLITCDEPNDKGDMHIEFSYEGDPTLAAFLLEDAAQSILEDQNEVQDGA